MAAKQPEGGRLAGLLGIWKKAMADAACGPLIIADDVMKIVGDWPRYQDETGGLSANVWLTKFVAEYGERGFSERQRAVQRIGEHARRTWDHHAAVWAAGTKAKLTDAQLKSLNEAVLFRMRGRGDKPLTPAQVTRLAYSMFDWMGDKSTKKQKNCDRCKALEAQILAMGGKLPE